MDILVKQEDGPAASIASACTPAEAAGSSVTTELSVDRPRQRLLFFVNDAGFFISHRLPIAQAAQQNGYDVVIACPASDGSRELEGAGFRVVDFDLKRGSVSIGNTAVAFGGIRRLFRQERPDLVHLVTSKPVIFGGIVARLMHIPSVAAISGLGHIFIDDSARSRVLKRAAMLGYRAALRGRSSHAIFQNQADADLFVSTGTVSSERITLLPGSGVDLSKFDPRPSDNAQPVCMLPARLLRTKGVEDFVAAARILRAEGHMARFVLQGAPDTSNPAAVPIDAIRGWEAEGVIEWWDFSTDVAGFLSKADIVVLPSYYGEGLPKSLVDAAAAGRAVVTTNLPGCRDAIEANVTGLLCRPRDPEHLAGRIALLLGDASRRRAMGIAGRARAEALFDIRKIVDAHLTLYRAAAG